MNARFAVNRTAKPTSNERVSCHPTNGHKRNLKKSQHILVNKKRISSCVFPLRKSRFADVDWHVQFVCGPFCEDEEENGVHVVLKMLCVQCFMGKASMCMWKHAAHIQFPKSVHHPGPHSASLGIS